MVDLAVDSEFNVYIDKAGNLAFVEGRNAFEQRVAIRLTEQFYEIVGSTNPSAVAERLRIEAQRVADTDPNINTMPSFNIEFSDEQINSADITIIYDTGETTEFTI